MDPSMYSRQAYFLAVYSILRLFFSCSLNYRIIFWNCLSNAKKFLYQLVYDNVINTRLATGLHLATSINDLYSKSVFSYLDA